MHLFAGRNCLQRRFKFDKLVIGVLDETNSQKGNLCSKTENLTEWFSECYARGQRLFRSLNNLLPILRGNHSSGARIVLSVSCFSCLNDILGIMLKRIRNREMPLPPKANFKDNIVVCRYTDKTFQDLGVDKRG